ncbi:hypothetical protein GQ44DRAFT_740757 [Phaeosphaeriaceae sp. PMI808]|nr:hypothetical protein GQ44DRAFT_740757 [Phaeosphaeriaceae sp. PMI808]
MTYSIDEELVAKVGSYEEDLDYILDIREDSRDGEEMGRESNNGEQSEDEIFGLQNDPQTDVINSDSNITDEGSIADSSDNWSDATELSVPDDFDLARLSNDETHKMYSFYEHHSYDPPKTKPEKLQWIDRCRVLAVNQELEEGERVFISGRGRDSSASIHAVYHVYDDDDDDANADTERQPPAFPFHEACFKILTKCLGYESKPRELNKDILHADEWSSSLDLDYGPVQQEQSWQCHAGEEWLTVDLAPDPGIEEVVRSILPAKLLDQPKSRPLKLAHRVLNDPFTVLPLSNKDTISLMKISWYVSELTYNEAFWKQMIRAFYWLDSITEPRFAMGKDFASIANRHRIWHVCEQLAPIYHYKLNEHTCIEPLDTPRTITAQFIRSWSEIGNRACELETYWTGKDGQLNGIGVTFGSIQRVFGSTNGFKGQSMFIEAGVQVNPIKMDTQDVKKDEITGQDDERALGYAYIAGMKNGIISRLGLLQAHHPDSAPPCTSSSYTPAQRLLWDSSAVYSHPNKALHTFSHPPFPMPSFVDPDMIPHSFMLWAPTFNEYKFLTRISMLQVCDESGHIQIIGIQHEQTRRHGSVGHIGESGPVPAQMRVDWAEAKSYEEFKIWEKLEPWEEDYMRHFDIDGPGGEVVSEVHVTSDRRGVKFITNLGREGAFADGKMIAGVSACFGRLEGWSQSAKRWSHWALNDLGVVIMELPEQKETKTCDSAKSTLVVDCRKP